jgi:S-adenosylmethionine hydrolase
MGGAPTVTLLTDFGTADSYVAEMKGAMLCVAPHLAFVDVSHDVAPGDLASARYLLARTWRRFPPRTVHLVVVDPGVGSSRPALAATRDDHGFVGPDNGVLGPVLTGARVVRLPVPAAASATFHGRDVFGPAAARLAEGAPLDALGEAFDGWVRGALPAPRTEGGRTIGEVVYADRFGTLVTNLPAAAGAARGTVVIQRAGVPLRRTFSDVEPGALVAFIGSGGTIEIAVRDGSASAMLGAGTGTEVWIGT